MNAPAFLRSIFPVAPKGVGDNLIADGGFEIWTSATDATWWVEGVAGSSTVNRESTTKHSDTYACRLDVDSSNNLVTVSQAIAGLRAGLPYRVSFWYKTGSAKTIKASLYMTYGGFNYYLQPDGTWKKSGDPGFIAAYAYGLTNTSWTQNVVDFIHDVNCDNSSVTFVVSRESATSSSIYLDDASVQCLLPSGAASLWVPGSSRYEGDRILSGRAADLGRGIDGQAYGFVIPDIPAHGYCREMLTDGALEIWASATDLTNWSESLSGTSTVNREATVKRRGGAYSCRLDVDSGNSSVSFAQLVSGMKPGRRYRVSFWYKTALNKSCKTFMYATYAGQTYYLQPDGSWKKVGDPGFTYSYVSGLTSTSWALSVFEFTTEATFDGSAMTFSMSRDMATSSSIYFDDASLRELVGSTGAPIQADIGWTFDGKSGYIEMPSLAPFAHNQFSAGAWVLVSALTGVSTFIISNLTAWSGWNLTLLSGTTLSMLIYTPSTSVNIDDTSSVSANKWYFVVATYDRSTQTGKLYRNGVLKRTNSSAGYTKSTSSLPAIGKLAAQNSGYFPGSIALPFYINRVLSAQEIANIYNATNGLFSPRG